MEWWTEENILREGFGQRSVYNVKKQTGDV